MLNNNFTYCGPDHCTQDGARAMASRLERYWRERGLRDRGEPYKVQARIKAHGFSPRMRERWFSVETDMVNGYPRDYFA